MHMDPAIPSLVGAIFAILIIGLFLRALRQPHVVGYLIAGLVLGPYGLGIIQDEAVLSRLGAIGVILLLFFIGMEVSPRRLVTNWKVSILGTFLQIIISIGCVWLLGLWLTWPVKRIIMIGFVISLSSTAVVLKFLQDNKEMDTKVGQNVLGISLIQDFAVIPMLFILGLMTGNQGGRENWLPQIIGTIIIFAIIGFLSIRDSILLPFGKLLRRDHEMQIFAGLAICFGLALFSGLFGLSAALGAFVAGMVIGVAKETQWIHHSMEPFRVVFVALFFVSIGMIVNLKFVVSAWFQISLIVMLVVITNTFINAAILRFLGDPWRDSLYAGALLSQIGEFSFVLAAVGEQSHIISNFAYQLVIAVISVSLIISPAWIYLMKRILSLKRPLLELDL